MAPIFCRNSVVSPHTRRWMCGAVLVILQVTGVGCALSPHGVVAQPNRTVAALADFLERANGYMRLHRGLLVVATEPPDVAKNIASQRALAQGIRAARRNAGQGEIITPAMAQILRSAMNPELRGPSAAGTRASIRDDAPTQFTLHVNDTYPEGVSRSTVPPNLLHVLPHLPDGLEYRIVGNHLVLLDVRAAVVVDYLVDVMCARC